ncbi:MULTISPECIES: hypothetical protein [Streptomyces]|uniref:ATP-binding protein n=1 Tax=Streptomyces luteosporeus TaxID=173856 RepID=A0ABN3TJ25_9ACTN
MRRTTLSSPSTIDLVTGETYRFTVPTAPPTARVARDLLGVVLAGTQPPGLVDDARVCVSDAVTHMIPRTPDPIDIEVTLRGPDVWVSVGTTSSGGRVKVYEPRSVEGRRCLRIMRSLAAESGETWTWGEGRQLVGKQVWFRLRG